jgi:hypothetical protein
VMNFVLLSQILIWLIFYFTSASCTNVWIVCVLAEVLKVRSRKMIFSLHQSRCYHQDDSGVIPLVQMLGHITLEQSVATIFQNFLPPCSNVVPQASCSLLSKNLRNA